MKYGAARTCHAGAARTCRASAYDTDVSRRDWLGAPPTAEQYFDGSTLIFITHFLCSFAPRHMLVKLFLPILICVENRCSFYSHDVVMYVGFIDSLSCPLFS